MDNYKLIERFLTGLYVETVNIKNKYSFTKEDIYFLSNSKNSTEYKSNDNFEIDLLKNISDTFKLRHNIYILSSSNVNVILGDKKVDLNKVSQCIKDLKKDEEVLNTNIIPVIYSLNFPSQKHMSEKEKVLQTITEKIIPNISKYNRSLNERKQQKAVLSDIEEEEIIIKGRKYITSFSFLEDKEDNFVYSGNAMDTRFYKLYKFIKSEFYDLNKKLYTNKKIFQDVDQLNFENTNFVSNLIETCDYLLQNLKEEKTSLKIEVGDIQLLLKTNKNAKGYISISPVMNINALNKVGKIIKNFKSELIEEEKKFKKKKKISKEENIEYKKLLDKRKELSKNTTIADVMLSQTQNFTASTKSKTLIFNNYIPFSINKDEEIYLFFNNFKYFFTKYLKEETEQKIIKIQNSLDFYINQKDYGIFSEKDKSYVRNYIESLVNQMILLTAEIFDNKNKAIDFIEIEEKIFNNLMEIFKKNKYKQKNENIPLMSKEVNIYLEKLIEEVKEKNKKEKECFVN